MKRTRILALLLAAVLLIGVFVACDSSKPEETTTQTTTKKTTTTLPVDPPPDVPEVVVEKPITGEEWRAWHDAMQTIPGVAPEVDLPVVWGDGAPEHLFDGKDGVINTDEETKLGGGDASGVVNLSFQAPNSKLIAYTFITGNDSGTKDDCMNRTASSWTLYGSKTGEDGTWVELDVVEDAGIVETPRTPYGYTIDTDKQCEYSFYYFEFTFGIDNTLTTLQYNELYLYTTPVAAE